MSTEDRQPRSVGMSTIVASRAERVNEIDNFIEVYNNSVIQLIQCFWDLVNQIPTKNTVFVQ